MVRAYVQEPFERERFEETNREYVERNRRLIRMFGTLYPAIQLLMGTGVVMVLWLGGRMVIGGSITLGEFVAFGTYLTMLHWPMIALGWVVNVFERGEASMGRIAQILEAEPEIRDQDPEPVTEIRGEVEFRGPDLRLRRQARAARHRPRRCPPGSTVAVVGPTGSGKTHAGEPDTASLRRATRDASWSTGATLRQIPLATLRGAVGFVPQETFLFSDVDPRERRLRRERTQATAEVEWAAEVAQLARDVARVPARLRDLRRGARHHALGRPEAAHRAWPGRWPPTRRS